MPRRVKAKKKKTKKTTKTSTLKLIVRRKKAIRDTLKKLVEARKKLTNKEAIKANRIARQKSLTRTKGLKEELGRLIEQSRELRATPASKFK